MTEALNSLFKAEGVRDPVMRGAGWRGIDDVERVERPLATDVDWSNQRRLHGRIGHVAPAELEATHWAAP